MADFLLRRNPLSSFDCDGQTQPPVPDRILGKAAAFHLTSPEALVQRPKGFAREAQRLSLALQLRCFKGIQRESVLIHG